MVAVVSGNGLGLFNASNNILGLSGSLGQDVLGQAANHSFVNAATGNVVLQMQDEVLSGRGFDLLHTRTYNSLGALTDVLGAGTGWTLNSERSVAFDETTGTAGTNGTVRRTTSDGATQTFTWNASLSLYVSDDGAGAQDTLSYDKNAHKWTYTNGSSRDVDVYGDSTNKATIGKLQTQTDASGNVTSYTYDQTTGRLTSIVDGAANGSSGSQQKLLFTYDSTTGRLTTVSLVQLTVDANGRATSTLGSPLANVTYQYYSNGRLKSVTTDLTPNDATDNADATKLYTTTYTYVTDSLLNPNLIASVTQSDGTTVSYSYYNSGANLNRVQSVTTGTGAGASVQSFSYGANSTTITDPTGQAWTYKYDSQQRLIELDAPSPGAGQTAPVTLFAYDSRGNLAQVTRIVDADPAHNQTIRYEYDARDNRTLERDSLGNTVVRAYDAKNQLITETRYTGVDSKGLDPDDTGTMSGTALVTHYIYDAQERLRFVISPEGRVTETRYESGGYGQLTRSVVYAGGRFDTTALSATGQEAQLATWASGQNQTLTQLTQYTYDLRGNLATKTAFGTVNASGVGVLDGSATVLKYIYDGHDALVQTIAMHGANRDQAASLASYGYDGLGREITRTNSSGTVNTVYDDAHGAIRITNTSSNLQELRTFDTAGRLTSLTQSDVTAGSTTPNRKTEYLYDPAGRVRVVQTVSGTDANGQEIVGARVFNFYDADGRLQYTVDTTGAVCGYTYDAAGHMLSTSCYATRAVTDSWVTATLVTAADGTKSTSYAIAKTALTVGASGSDVIADSVHDRTTVNTYDAAGRRATTTDGEGTVTTMSYDGNSRVTRVQVGTSAAGYRTTQYFYDQDGNQVGVLDPLGFLVERKYDAASRLTETVRYSNRAQNVGDVSAPVWNGVANQTANIGRLFVYHLPAAFDADGDAINYSIVGTLPSWLTFDAKTLTLSGTPPVGTTGADVTLQAADGTGSGAKSQTASVHITIVNAAPDWAIIPDAAVEVNTAGFSIVLPAATDNETAAAQLKYSVPSSLWPPGMTFNASTKTLSGTPTTAGTYVITATVTDTGSPALSTQRTFTVVVTNKGPSWPADLSTLPHAFRTQPFDYVVSSAIDPDGQALTYTKISGPDWLTLADASKPELTGTAPAGTPVGPATVVLEARDPAGAVVRLSFSVTVEGVPPTWTGDLQYSTLAGQKIDYTPIPAVDPDGSTLTYDLIGAIPSDIAGLTIDHTTGRLFLAATNPANVKDYTVTVRATDAEGKYVERGVALHLTDSAPTYVGGVDANYDGWQFNPKTVLIPYSAFNDINGPFTLSVDGATPGLMPFTGGTIPWQPGFYFEPNYTGIGVPIHGSADSPTDPGVRPLGVLTWYDPNAAAGTVRVITLRATDSQGLSVVRQFTITIKALPPPPPPPPPPPAPPPGPPGGPPIQPLARIRPDQFAQPIAPIPAAPTPVLGEPEAAAPALAPAPAPKAAATLAPTVDVLAAVRPSDTTGLHSYFYYDGQGRVTGSVDERGVLTENVYDDAANTQQTIKYRTFVTVGATDTLSDLRTRAGVADVSSVAYDSFGRVSTSTAVGGTVTRYQYDAAGRVARLVIADGTSNQRATRTRYDVFGAVTGIVTGVGEATLAGAPTQAQIDAAIATYGSQSFYDSLGRKIKVTDANNHSTYLYYDADNRLTHTVDAAGGVTETIYNAFGQASSARAYATALTSTQLAALTGGSSSTLTLPVLKASTDRFVDYTFDRRGLVLTTSGPITGFVTTNTYTAFGQLETQARTIARGNNGAPNTTTAVRNAYDLDGRLILTTADFGGLNYNSQTFYDAFGRVTSTVDGAGNTVTTSYRDDNGQDTGRVIQVTDALGRKTRDDYDAYGRVLTHTDALGKATRYDYNPTTRTTTVTTPEGVVVKTTVDELGQTVSVQDGRGNTTSYTYDLGGHVLTATGPSGTVTNHYDASGRLDYTIDARQTRVNITYDAVNRVLTRMVDPTGLKLQTQYFYDAFGQVFKTIDGGVRTTSYKRDQEGRLTQVIVDPNGLKLSTAYAYDGLGNITRIDQGGGATPSQQVTMYVFDKLGRRIKEIVAPHTATSIGIGSPNNRDLTTQYVYDSAGRVSRKIDANGQSIWYVYDAAGELRYTVNALGEVSESVYDLNGRVIQTRQYVTRLAAATVAGFGDAIASFTPPGTSTDDARTYLSYDDDGRLRFTVQAVVGDGTGKWSVSENRYDANGNVVQALRYDQFLTNARITANTADGSLSIGEVSAELVTLGYKDTALGASATDETTLSSINRQRFAYDASNRLRFAVNAVGAVVEHVYDETGNVLTTVAYAAVPTLTAYTESAISAAVNRANPENHTTQFAYDKAGRLVYTARVLGVDGTGKANQQFITKRSYDSVGNLTLVREYAAAFGALANYTLATLDAAVNASAIANDPRNRTTAFAYDVAGRQVYAVRVLAVDSTGAATQQIIAKTTYDGVNHVVQTTRFATPFGALANYTLATLDTATNAPAAASDPQNRTMAFVYDAAGRAAYSIRVLAVDSTGKATQQLVTNNVYDALGNLVRTTAYATTMALADYKLATLDLAVASRVSDQDRTSYVAYDAVGRRVYSADTIGLDATGKPQQRISQMTYDALGRLVKSTSYAAKLTLTDFSKAALDTAVSATTVANDPLNRTTAYAFDAAGELIYTVQVVEADSTGKPTKQTVTQTSYDANGQVVKTIEYADFIAPADYKKTTLDAAVALTSVKNNPLNRITAYAYDAAGEQVYSVRVMTINGSGVPTQHLVVRNTFDAFGQVVQTKAYATPVALSNYLKKTIDTAVAGSSIANNINNRTSASAYDTLGRQVYGAQVLTVNGSGVPTQHVVTKRTYDAFDQVTQATAFATPMALADYKLATFDTAAAASASAQDRATRYVYDLAGRGRFVLGADGSLTESVFDGADRVIESRFFATPFTFDPTKAYVEADLVAMRGGAHVGDGTTRGKKYEYDLAGRLTKTTDAANFTEVNTYDGVDNRIAFTDKAGSVWTYSYDALGQLRTQTSPAASVRLSNGTVRNGGLTTVYTYDAFGGLSTRDEANGTVDHRLTVYSYDLLGRSTEIETALYDPALGRVVNGQPTANDTRFWRRQVTAYDAFGDVVRTGVRIDAATYQYDYHAYDNLGRLTYEVDALHNVTGYGYNSFGERTTVTRYSVGVPATPGPTNTTCWVPADVAAKVAGDTQSRTLTTTYDLMGRAHQVTAQASSNYYAGSTATTSNAATITQPAGGAPAPTTVYDYNVFGQLVHESQQVTGTSTRETWHYYDVMGRESLTVDAGHYQTARTYDALGNLKTVTESVQPGQVGTLTTPPPALTGDPYDRITLFGYDALDRQTSMSRKNFRYTNAQGIEVSSGDSAVVLASTTYDALGHAKTQTDALGNVTVMEYNALGQVTKITEPARQVAVPQVATPSNPNSTPNAIDPFLNKKTVTPVTSYTLNAFGQVVAQSRVAYDVNGGAQVGGVITSSTQYDVAGNVISKTDANNNVTNYRVDFAGRVIEKSQDVNVTLGNWGNLTQTIKQRYVYDAVGRQTDVLAVYTDANGALQQTGEHQDFNAFGELKADYREWGAATTAPASLTRALVATYDYDKTGHQISKSAGDGVTKFYYDLTGALTRQEQYALAFNTDGSGTVKLNADGTVAIDTTVAPRITEIGYDALGRSSIVRSPSMSARRAGTTSDVLITPIVQTTYDRWGNVTQRIQGGYALNSDGSFSSGESRVSQYRYDSSNRVIAAVLPTVAATRANGSTYLASVTHESHYDIGGRLVSERDVADDTGTGAIEATVLRTRRHEYDAVGEVTADVDGTNVRVEYAYDSNGNRVGTRNVGNGAAGSALVNTVLVDSFDADGNLLTHSVLRTNGGSSPYLSGSGQTPVLYILKVFQYDQASRRVASADVMHDPTNVFWTYTKYDERNLVTAQRTPNIIGVGGVGPVDFGIVTSYAYDQFGNRTLQLDGKQNGQTWAYRTDSYIVGQLRFTAVGTAYNSSTQAFGTTNRTTTYAYSGFGQSISETYTGSVMTAGGVNNRTYAYYENGLVKQVSDNNANGIAGPDGGADYWSTTATSTYDYSVNGERVQATFTLGGAADDAIYGNEGEIVAVGPTPIAFTPSTRMTRMSYDAQGRLIDVQAPAAQNAGHASISDLIYQYDELGNRRRIYSVYQRPGDSTALASDKWYAYDAEGRLTVVDGRLAGGVIDAAIAGATSATYDALGRRATTVKYVGGNSSDDHLPTSEDRTQAQWTEYDGQSYDYNDLGYLTKTWQSIIRRDITVTVFPHSDGGPPKQAIINHYDEWDGSSHLLENRVLDVRGGVIEDTLYSGISVSPADYQVDFGGTKASHMLITYLADGRLNGQLTEQFNADGTRAGTSYLSNTYDNSNGVLDHYTYQQDISNASTTSTYQYAYTMEFGGYREKTITVTSPSAQTGTTTNQYDSRGNLTSQIITNPGQTRSRVLYYDNNGQIISKSESFHQTGQVGTFGSQDFFYVDGHEVAVLGTGTLDTAQFINDFTPVTTSAGTAPGTYVVNSGDSLASIAQSLYGDAQLWYLIADANSVSYGPSQPLPSTEIGRVYRIPTTFTDHSNATTFTPYNASAIIGNSSPSPYLPPPPGPSCAEQVGKIVAVAVVVAVSVAVSVYTAGALSGVMGPVLANMIGAVAASAASQGVGIGLGVQKDFSTEQLGEAAIGGFVGGFVSAAEAGAAAGGNSVFTVSNGAGSFANSYANIAQGAVVNELTGLLTGHGITEKGIESSLFSLGARLGGNALFSGGDATSGLSWSSIFQGVVGAGASAVNPFQDQPFSWTNLASQALNGLVSVAVSSALSRRQRMQETDSATSGSVESDHDRITDRDQSMIEEMGLTPDQAADAARGEIAALSEPTVDERIAKLGDDIAAFKTSLGQEYTSQKSDRTLEDVAERFYGKDYRWLATALGKASGINPLSFRPGMRVVVPNLEDLDLDAARAMRATSNQHEKQVKDDREWDQHVRESAARYRAQLAANAENEAAAGGPAEPPSEEMLQNLGMRLNEPAVQKALLNPDFGKSIPVTKSVIQDGITYQITGTHVIGSQPELDADFTADMSIVDITNHETASDIARRTGQADYLTFDAYAKKNPQLSGEALVSSYRGYHRANDAETKRAWDSYDRSYRVGTAIAKYTLETPLIVAAPGTFVAGELVGAYGHDVARWGARVAGVDESWGDLAADAVQLGMIGYGAVQTAGALGGVLRNGAAARAAERAMASEVGAAERAEQAAATAEGRVERSAANGFEDEPTIVDEFPDTPTAPQSPYGSGLTKRPLQPRNGETVSGEFEIKDLPNKPVDESPQVYVRFQHKTFDTLDDAMVDAQLNFNPDSIREGHELSGLPFRTPEGRYGYSGPTVELNNSANISDPATAIIDPQWGTRLPADWHTHGNYFSAVERYAGQNPTLVPSSTPGEFLWRFPNGDRFAPNTFSGMDVQGAWALADDFGTHYTRYLGTPSGSIRWMTAQPTALGGGLAEGMMFPPGTTIPH